MRIEESIEIAIPPETLRDFVADRPRQLDLEVPFGAEPTDARLLRATVRLGPRLGGQAKGEETGGKGCDVVRLDSVH
jgi:hypothetical protein